MDLSEFLLARIAEDEECARRLLAPYAWGWSSFHEASPDELEHIARHDPARVLADCVAVRAIVDAWRAAEAEADSVGEMRSVGTAEGLEEAMMLLAQPFAAHPDFDPAWR